MASWCSTASAAAPAAPPAPSNRFVKYQEKGFAIALPDNWKVQESEGGVILAPAGGIVAAAGSDSAQAYGASISRYVPSSRRMTLQQATQQVIDSLRNSNPNLKLLQQSRGRVKGRAAYSTLLENDSPLQGQKETDHLLTISGRDGILVVVFIAPQSAYDSYRPTFEQMLKSLEVR